MSSQGLEEQYNTENMKHEQQKHDPKKKHHLRRVSKNQFTCGSSHILDVFFCMQSASFVDEHGQRHNHQDAKMQINQDKHLTIHITAYWTELNWCYTPNLCIYLQLQDSDPGLIFIDDTY